MHKVLVILGSWPKSFPQTISEICELKLQFKLESYTKKSRSE